jgi:hypothetical protein
LNVGSSLPESSGSGTLFLNGKSMAGPIFRGADFVCSEGVE